MTTIAMLGAGIMASALTVPQADNGHDVHLVGTHLDREIIDSVKATRIHPGLQRKLPEAVHAYRLEEAETAFDGAAVALSGVNSFGVRWASSSPTSDRPPGRVGDRAGPPAAALGRPGRPRRLRPDPSTPAMHPVPTVLIPRGSGEPPWILR